MHTMVWGMYKTVTKIYVSYINICGNLCMCTSVTVIHLNSNDCSVNNCKIMLVTFTVIYIGIWWKSYQMTVAYDCSVSPYCQSHYHHLTQKFSTLTTVTVIDIKIIHINQHMWMMVPHLRQLTLQSDYILMLTVVQSFASF